MITKTRSIHLWILSIVFFGGFLHQGCYYDNEKELYPFMVVCDSTDISFSADIVPIITDNCSGCHSAPVNSGGVNLEGYSSISIYADNGLLSCVVNHTPGCSPMPQNLDKLNSCDIVAIESWIAEGKQNN